MQVNEEQNIGDTVVDLKTVQGSTPGPWLLKGPMTEEEHECGHRHCDEHPKRMTGYDIWSEGEDGTQRLWLASIHGEHVDIPREQAEANARLFYAAPALYEACRQFVHWYAEDSTEEKRDNAYDAAVAALALVNKPDTNSANLDHPAHGQASKTEVQK